MKKFISTSFFLLLLSSIVLFTCAQLNAQVPGDLDTTFGTAGIVTTDIIGYYDAAYAMALQDDGKIILTGYSLENAGANREITLVRYMPDGNIDNDFGTNGIVITDVSDREGEAYSIGIQPDGKIVVAGYSESSNTNVDAFTVVRYETNGIPDNTFGTNGIVITEVSNENDEAESLVIQPNGKIIVAGWTNHLPNDDIALVRYNPDGSMDNSFGSDGIVTTDINSNHDYGKAVAIQTDGKILVTGHTVNPSLSQWSIFVASYDSIGNLDTTFGGEGIVITTIGNVDDDAFGKSICIQEDGKILVAGNSNSTGSYHFTTVRYNQDGSLDNSFGSNGIKITQIGNNSEANSIVVDSKGYIITGGRTDLNNNDFAMVRYETTGILDTNFGIGGILTTDFNSRSNERIYSIIVQADDNIIASGESDNGFSDFAIARYIGGEILHPEIIVLSPNGGESFKANDSQRIIWHSKDVDDIKIEYSVNNGLEWLNVVDSLNAPSGQYEWTIPEVNSQDCLVRIASILEPDIFDISDSVFSISHKLINIISPNGGESFKSNAVENITWSSSGIPNVTLLYSITNGAQWDTIALNQISTGIYSWTVPSTATTQGLVKIIDYSDDQIFDISDSTFIIEPLVSIDGNENIVPNEYVLFTNYPNPFNPSTYIKFGLPKESKVTLIVYNVLGQEVTKLINQQLQAGYHEVEFNSSNYSAGIYFYRIQAGDFAETKKMILLK